MASYRIEVKSSAQKDLQKLPSGLASRIAERIDSLAENPFPAGIHKLQGTEAFFRIRVGNYRIIYAVHSKEELVVIHHVRHRKDVYRRL